MISCSHLEIMNFLKLKSIEVKSLMDAVSGDALDPAVEERFLIPIKKFASNTPPITRIDRFAFYSRAKNAYAVVLTGELAKYGNILLKKGVTPV